MKKLLLNAFFLGCTTLAFAQAAFTQKTFNDMMQGFQTGSEEFLKTQFLPDFLLVGSTGVVFTLPEFMAFTKGGTTLTSDFSNVKIRQYDKTAIATGIWAHSHRLKNNNVVAYKELFTYTFVEQKGKWLAVSAQHSVGPTVLAEEEAAVKKALVDERNVFHAGDKDGMFKFWKNDPRTFVMASYNNGQLVDMNNERVQKAISDFKPNDQSTGTIADSKVNIYGNIAVANFEKTTNFKNGTQNKEHDIAILEKESDGWKFIGYSVHGIPKDKKEEEAAIKKVIEKETQTWLDRDAEGMTSCFANVEYALQLVYHGNMASNNGIAYSTNEKKNAPEQLKAFVASMGKSDGSTFKNDNYVVRVSGASAFAYFDQTTTSTTGEKQHFYETRYLEKVNGEWKIVYVGAVKGTTK